MVESILWGGARKYLRRHRDATFCKTLSKRVASLGILQVLGAPRSSWQNFFVVRLTETLRGKRQVIELNTSHTRRILTGSLNYCR
jgi:hypothetical protein